MSRLSIGLLLVTLLVAQEMSGSAGRVLTKKEVNLLITNLPVALNVKRNGGCPVSDYSELDPSLAIVQLRNRCPHSGSGLIGNYVVDLKSGKIWSDIDRQ